MTSSSSITNRQIPINLLCHFLALRFPSTTCKLCKHDYNKEAYQKERKWQKIASIGKKRIASERTSTKIAAAAANDYNRSSEVVKGCFVIFTMDKRRFLIPLAFLSICIFRELFKLSEEEFGLPSDGAITFPCDSVFMNYIVSIVK
ncbi:auxin-responsive protein SAUR66-like [Gossypium arboreum]|uniref:Uncharacterized protein n=1 Tax=Gossypium arboreum TaxID=29729 RepID=A0ABR0QFM1_GOSAR|nr:auxin-responsive protein SAUR66-like [Gossypium arboreum]KAK5837727.1 hypothetical protein PVK06_006454 [Gossypium arboreum]